MKLAVAFVALVAVASAGYIKPNDPALAELEAIVAAIQSPSTDPATASLLEQQLADLLEAHVPAPAPEPVVIEPSPIAVGPTLIDFPVPDGGALTPGLVPVAPEAPAVVPSPVVVPSPAVVAPAESSPLVQIIVNVQSAGSSAVVPGAPAAAAPVEAAFPVTVVDEAVNHPSVVPTPVVVVDEAPEPVVVVDEAPAPVVVAPEPILVGEPIVPVPVVTLPETLN